jgi:peptidoglycan/xylan/chitin deacetylase (PgdA/CDA1 family)
LELANNGLNYEDFTTFTLAQQEQLLVASNNRLKAIFGVAPQTFISPYGTWNANTVTALKSQGFKVLLSVDSPLAASYPITGASFYQLSVTALTSQATNEATYVPTATTLSAVQSSYNTYGYAIVGLSPDTFSVGDNPTNTLNTAAMTGLQSLITQLQQDGYTFVTLSQLVGVPLPQPISSTPTSCNCVAFRMDDVQDYWITPAMEMIMSTFISANVPLSIGIIANEYGTDPGIVAAVTAAIKSPLIEVMCHGWNHEDFSTFTYAQQVTLLTECRTKILKLHPSLGNVTNFMPPFNSIDYNTYLAAITAGYTQLCSEVSQDLPPYGNSLMKGLLRTPIGAQTSAVDAAGQYVGIPHTVTLQQIETQIQAYGYAAVMMHPQEFSPLVNEAPQNGINATMQTELNLLIAAVKSAGYNLVTVGGLRPLICQANPSNCVTWP